MIYALKDTTEAERERLRSLPRHPVLAAMELGELCDEHDAAVRRRREARGRARASEARAVETFLIEFAHREHEETGR